MENKRIDVLIPAYNTEKYIHKCLDSLLNQTYKNLRIVIVDDGSTDDTLNIIKEYQSRHPNIECYEKENDKNISQTRNFLLSKIKSPYFSFFDSDDYAHPTYFEHLYNLLVSYGADISICRNIRRIDKEINFEKLNKNNNKIYFFNKEEALAEMLSSNLYAGTGPAKLIKSTLVQNNLFNTQIHYGEDLDFCFKIMQNCKSIVFSNKILYHYIIRKNSIVTSKFKENKLSCIDCYENITNNVKDNKLLFTCAKSMQGLIAIELLYYTWRDKYKNKQVKKKLKTIIKQSIPYIKKNKRLSKLLKCTPAVWWLTKFM